MLELFCATIVNTPLLRTSHSVVEFLSSESLQTNTAMITPTHFEEYTTLDGKVVLEITPFLNRYYSNITSYLQLTNTLYCKTTDSSRHLFESLDDTKSKMVDLESNIRSIKDLTDHFNSQNQIGNFGILSLVTNDVNI